MVTDSFIRTLAAERYVLDEMNEQECEEYEAHFFGCAQCALEIQLASEFMEDLCEIYSGEPTRANVLWQLRLLTTHYRRHRRHPSGRTADKGLQPNGSSAIRAVLRWRWLIPIGLVILALLALWLCEHYFKTPGPVRWAENRREPGRCTACTPDERAAGEKGGLKVGGSVHRQPLTVTARLL